MSRLTDRLRESRMCVNRARQFLSRTFQSKQWNSLCDELGCVRPNNVDPQNLTVLFFGHDLYEPGCIVDDLRLAHRGERELPDLDRVPLVLCLRLRQPDRAHFRIGIGTIRTMQVVDGLNIEACDVLNGQDRFMTCCMSELGVPATISPIA